MGDLVLREQEVRHLRLRKIIFRILDPLRYPFPIYLLAYWRQDGTDPFRPLIAGKLMAAETVVFHVQFPAFGKLPGPGKLGIEGQPLIHEMALTAR